MTPDVELYSTIADLCDIDDDTRRGIVLSAGAVERRRRLEARALPFFPLHVTYLRSGATTLYRVVRSPAIDGGGDSLRFEPVTAWFAYELSKQHDAADQSRRDQLDQLDQLEAAEAVEAAGLGFDQLEPFDPLDGAGLVLDQLAADELADQLEAEAIADLGRDPREPLDPLDDLDQLEAEAAKVAEAAR